MKDTSWVVESKRITERTSESLLGHIEKIVELSEKTALSDDFFQKASLHIDYVKSRLNLSKEAIVFLSIFVNNSDEGRIQIKELAKHLGCRKIKILQYMESIDELEKLRFIRCCRNEREQNYRVPINVIKALTKEQCPEIIDYSTISIEKLFDILAVIFEEKNENELTDETLLEELEDLINKTQHLALSKSIKKVEELRLDIVLILLFCHYLVNENDAEISFFELGWYFDSKHRLRMTKQLLKEQNHPLIENNWLKCTNNNGLSDSSSYCLTNNAKKELLSEITVYERQAILKKKLILYTSLHDKQLFYNANEQNQIERLSNLLQPENFKLIQNRLTENGMRDGFACLFYGAPGTGKTETVYQLARQTGRDILPVNVSEIKSCWVGETEKNIKSLFDEYRECVSKTKIAPILLFNEADAVLGVRTETRHSVDKMENSMQNIILQEMENLNGIMIATTNLIQNLDNAFERRFLYKIEFLTPSIEARTAIWKTMIPELSNTETRKLAVEYNFSGGQIENIARKCTVEYIINDVKPSMKILHELCENERLKNISNRAKIGFY